MRQGVPDQVKALNHRQSAVALTAVVEQGFHLLLDHCTIGHCDAEEQAQQVCHISQVAQDSQDDIQRISEKNHMPPGLMCDTTPSCLLAKTMLAKVLEGFRELNSLLSSLDRHPVRKSGQLR